MKAVRNEYAEIGVDQYYEKHGEDYTNPHEGIIHKLLEKAVEGNYIGKKVIDLCCGSGEVTCGLAKYQSYEVVGIDPYTVEAYFNRVGQKPIKLSFLDITQGKLKEELKKVSKEEIKEKFDTIICSFALHLCDESMLPTLLWELGEVANSLIVITPNKKPDCDNVSSWYLVEEIMVERVRMRIYLR